MTLAALLGFKSRQEMHLSLTPSAMTEWHTYYTLTNLRPDAVQHVLARLGESVYMMLGGKPNTFNKAAIAPSMGALVGRDAAESDEDHKRLAESAESLGRMFSGGGAG